MRSKSVLVPAPEDAAIVDLHIIFWIDPGIGLDNANEIREWFIADARLPQPCTRFWYWQPISELRFRDGKLIEPIHSREYTPPFDGECIPPDLSDDGVGELILHIPVITGLESDEVHFSLDGKRWTKIRGLESDAGNLAFQVTEDILLDRNDRLSIAKQTYWHGLNPKAKRKAKDKTKPELAAAENPA